LSSKAWRARACARSQARAGYTPAALYFHFDSKEAIDAEVPRSSLASLGAAVNQAVAKTKSDLEFQCETELPVLRAAFFE
jgi:AcrR family transcriptional regulator